MHAAQLAHPHTQTTSEELRALASHARGRVTAVEIGTFMGASACVIAASLCRGGRLYCIDPWERRNGKPNPCEAVARREIRRLGLAPRIECLVGTAADMISRVPPSVDFIFVDGDHSLSGIQTDWEIVRARLKPGGVVCLHDTIPRTDPTGPAHDSVAFYRDTIRHDPEFTQLAAVETLSILERIV